MLLVLNSPRIPSLTRVCTYMVSVYLSLEEEACAHTHSMQPTQLVCSFSPSFAHLLYSTYERKDVATRTPTGSHTNRQIGLGTVIDKDAFSCGRFSHRHSRPETLSPIWPRRRTAAGVNHSHQIGAGFRFVSR